MQRSFEGVGGEDYPVNGLDCSRLRPVGWGIGNTILDERSRQRLLFGDVIAERKAGCGGEEYVQRKETSEHCDGNVVVTDEQYYQSLYEELLSSYDDPRVAALLTKNTMYALADDAIWPQISAFIDAMSQRDQTLSGMTNLPLW